MRPSFRLRVGMPQIRLDGTFGLCQGVPPPRLTLPVARNLAQHQPAVPVVVEFLSLYSLYIYIFLIIFIYLGFESQVSVSAPGALNF